MGKKLKVAFAMGGGASLGAFSGGAIAEVLRQLHMNLDRSVYDTVEIDVLSGASAGGMTLDLLRRRNVRHEPIRQAMRLIGFMDAPEVPGTYDRVLISTSEGDDRFHLTGAAGGDDTELVGVDVVGVARIETIVRFNADGIATIDGPHVHARGETRRLAGDEAVTLRSEACGYSSRSAWIGSRRAARRAGR